MTTKRKQKAKAPIPEGPVVLKVALLGIAVCVPAGFSDDEVLQFARTEPCGTTNGWVHRDRIQFGPMTLPLSDEMAKELALFKADLIANERTFLEVTTPTHYTLTIPTDQPVIVQRLW